MLEVRHVASAATLVLVVGLGVVVTDTIQGSSDDTAARPAGDARTEVDAATPDATDEDADGAEPAGTANGGSEGEEAPGDTTPDEDLSVTEQQLQRMLEADQQEMVDIYNDAGRSDG